MGKVAIFGGAVALLSATATVGAAPVIAYQVNAPSSGNAINATSMWAFGSVSMTLPPSALTLASSLLHEFQHAKLGALLDLYKLYHDDGARRSHDANMPRG